MLGRDATGPARGGIDAEFVGWMRAFRDPLQAVDGKLTRTSLSSRLASSCQRAREAVSESTTGSESVNV